VEILALALPEGDLWGPIALSTFVSVGNATQPFHRLLGAVCELAHQLPQPVFVQYGSAQDFSCPSCNAVAFVDMQAFERQVAEAELLILHAGAGSLIHAVTAGKVPVIMPRRAHLGEHVDDHQLEFARELAAVGKVVMCEDASKLVDAVAEALKSQRQNLNAAGEPALVGMIRAVLHGHGA
jgi:beta-1,4-N-acetylglucosaminyltransferase